MNYNKCIKTRQGIKLYLRIQLKLEIKAKSQKKKRNHSITDAVLRCTE